jgi:acyl carrier protein
MPADQRRVLADLTEVLHAILGEFGTDVEITLDTTFRDDLGMESLDVVSLAGRLQARYGSAVNLAQFAAAFDLDSIRELRVGQLVEYISRSLDEQAPMEAASS